MSRIAKNPINVPTDVKIRQSGRRLFVEGKKGVLERDIHPLVELTHEDRQIRVSLRAGKTDLAIAGTMRSLIDSMVIGVSEGFERRLNLIGVGYRAQFKNNTLTLALGFSHPVNYIVPKEMVVEIPSPTEIVIKGADKQKVSQVAADIRSFRSPEPYKGKGVRYANEQVIRKEAKKK